MFDFIKNLFQKQEAHNVPFIQKSLERSDKEKADYLIWENTQTPTQLGQIIKEQYYLYKDNKHDAATCAFFSSPVANGFILYPDDENFSTADYRHFLDWLHQTILPLQYRQYLSDVKNYVRKNGVETKERHYIKPKLTRDPNATKAFQQYGNITIELELLDDKVKLLKLLCSVYHDHKFHKHLAFEGLINILFATPTK